MSFGELLFLGVLGLLVFGPRKLPEIARQFGKIMTDLRRASNEFRYSLEDEIRDVERVEQEKKRLQAAETAPAAIAGTIARVEEPAPAVVPSATAVAEEPPVSV